MDEYLNKLQEKYGYSKELIDALEKIIPAFVQHYGQEYEHVILDAIFNCEIHLKSKEEKATEYLSEFFPNKNIGKIPIIVTAFYDSMPIMTDEGVSSKRLVYLQNNDLQNDKVISTLVHELGHLIKSYNREFSIVNGKIQQRSGISTTTLNKDEETGKYSEGQEESNTGIEEAINCYDEEKIMSIILGREFRVDSYFHRLNDVINYLFDENKELVEIFRRAQINGTDEHIKYLGQEEFKTLSEDFENLYFILMKPHVACKVDGVEKDVRQLLRDAIKKILTYADKYKDKKRKNFSMKEVSKIDEEITFNERESGMSGLKKEIQEQQKKTEMMEEKRSEPRI